MIEYIVTFLSGSLIGVIATHLLYKSKLDKEGQAKIEGNIREEIHSSLKTFKELIQDLNNNNIMYYEELIKDEKLDFFNQQPISPNILTSMDQVSDYYDRINTMRNIHLDKLNEPLAATLYCLERYFLNLQKYLHSLRQDQYQLIGSIIINDFQKFYEVISTLIYNEFGKYRSEYFKHNSKDWEQTKEKYIEMLWTNSNLFGLMFPDELTNSNSDQILVHMSQALKEGVGNNNLEENESVKEVQRILNAELD